MFRTLAKVPVKSMIVVGVLVGMQAGCVVRERRHYYRPPPPRPVIIVR